MPRDPRDCLCPGATLKEVLDKDGRPVMDDNGQAAMRYVSNDPSVRCPVHPHGYDPMTGKNG